jgi:hypothetical protein
VEHRRLDACFTTLQIKSRTTSMSVWRFVDYLFLATGSPMALFENNDIVEIVSVVPSGLLETTLSIRLIAKGFNPSALAPKNEHVKARRRPTQ